MIMPTAMFSCSYTSLPNWEYKFGNCSLLSKCCEICKVQFFSLYTICTSKLRTARCHGFQILPRAFVEKVDACCSCCGCVHNFVRHYPILRFYCYRFLCFSLLPRSLLMTLANVFGNLYYYRSQLANFFVATLLLPIAGKQKLQVRHLDREKQHCL